MTELTDALISSAVRGGQVTDVVKRLIDIPQAAANVRHIFGPNVYMRELSCAAGTLIIGRPHRMPHHCILVKGTLAFFNSDGTVTSLSAIAELEAGPGRKIARAETDIIFVNSWVTPERDVETLEREIFEDEVPEDTRPMLEPDGDFETMLKEQGVSREVLDRVSHRTDDLGPFPYGAYKVKVGRSRIEGRGLIATADIAPQEFIAPGVWQGKRTPAGRYTNHAKDPNAAFGYGADGIAWLIAQRPIAGSRGGFDGDEVTVDYRRTPRVRWEDLS